MVKEIFDRIKKGEQITYKDLEQLDHLLLREYGCTGNSGRSPLADAIDNEYILDNGLENRFLAISSGTKRDANVSGNSVPSIDNQLFVMGRAVARNDELRIYSPEEALEITGMLANEDKTKQDYETDQAFYDAVRNLDTKGRSRLMEEEHEFRARAAKDIGLSIPIKDGGQQTEPCDKVKFFYAMAESNEKDARAIYSGQAHQPVFDNFGIPNTFGLPYDQYKEMVCGLKEKVIQNAKQSEESLR
ncbi:hypothetical protein ACFL96_03110 [Thermoproteota archaeon]